MLTRLLLSYPTSASASTSLPHTLATAQEDVKERPTGRAEDRIPCSQCRVYGERPKPPLHAHMRPHMRVLPHNASASPVALYEIVNRLQPQRGAQLDALRVLRQGERREQGRCGRGAGAGAGAANWWLALCAIRGGVRRCMAAVNMQPRALTHPPIHPSTHIHPHSATSTHTQPRTRPDTVSSSMWRNQHAASVRKACTAVPQWGPQRHGLA